MNAQTFNALMNQQVPWLTLRQRELLKKRLDELDEQQKGLAVIESSSATEPRCCPHCQGTALARLRKKLGGVPGAACSRSAL